MSMFELLGTPPKQRAITKEIANQKVFEPLEILETRPKLDTGKMLAQFAEIEIEKVKDVDTMAEELNLKLKEQVEKFQAKIV